MRSKSRESEPGVPVRRIAALFVGYRRRLTGLVALLVLQAGVSVSAPFLLREILDRAIPERDVPLLSLLALGMLASAAGTAMLSAVTNRLSNVIGQGIMHDVRVAVYEHLQRMSLGYFTRTRAGATLSRITSDIAGVDAVLTNTVTAMVQSGVSALAVAVALVVLDWQLALVALVVVPGMLLLTPRLGRRRRAVAGHRQRRISGLTALTSESLSVSGILLAKTMGNRDELRDRFVAESREVSRLEIAASMMGRWSTASRRASLVAVPAVVYWLAGVQFAHGIHPSTLGTVVAFTSMLNRLVSPIGTMQGIGQGVSASMALFTRIFEVLDLPVDIAEAPGATPLAVAGAAEVALRDVWFRYGDDDRDDWTLRGIDLTVPAGRRLAIVGATGSGKTTLAYLIARLYDPQRGAVTIGGTDVRAATLDSLAAVVGLVSQETYLFHDTVAANLRFARPDASDADLVAACRAARVHDAIAALPDGYDTVVGERGFRFSGGERQRLAIARVLLRDPPVLILDEATSALDTGTEREVQLALDAAAAGRTTIAIAHRLSTVRDADEIVVLHAGSIVERGRHAELVAAGGRYASLVASGHAAAP
ncbi:multidrug ABC transporter ATP-binding protein [Actinocatenispora thailandica]|uniref:Multidrug ABC transporter ATP-binding protein n=1 Tax=Actinocatenispora thailandica TaxID=227318 RepID=A0A7R7DRQ6_9ACTN|nr:ABC transporter ATP-binding protein [Actinocatenispora thailandica]BCJ36496.1 multidrug ABC transporter ATP-binding protein [Actinocatenispora thailandica]